MKQSHVMLFAMLLVPGLIATVLLAGCASSGTTEIYASADEQHALLSYPSPGDIRSDFYPAVLQEVDGRSVQSAQRLTFRLKPGTHEIRLQPKPGLILSNLPKGMNARKVPGWFERRAVEITLEAGKHYVFGARITGEDYSGWQPVVKEKAAQ